MASKQKTNQTVRLATPEMLRQIWAIVLQALPTRLTFAQAQYWIGHGVELAKKIRAIFAVVDPYREQIAAWEKFYHDELGITVDLSGLAVPDRKPGFGWLIVVVPGVTIEMVLAAMKKRFKVWRWTSENLDEQMAEGGRSAANGSYAIWVRDCTEADEEHKGKSHDDLQGKVVGITLLEYALLHLKHFTETKTHLDSSNITLCTGLLCRDGSVPLGYWSVDDGAFFVYGYHRDGADGDLRTREAVV